jgi:hypothetical protein
MSHSAKGTLQGIIHEAGKPIMTDEQVANASRAMVNLMHNILFLEEGLLKETNPSYPDTSKMYLLSRTLLLCFSSNLYVLNTTNID